MPATTSTARREAFFSALAQTGNLSLAAERVRLSHFWHKSNRKRDPAFRARCDAAIAEARARLARAPVAAPAIPGWSYAPGGEELTVRNGGRGRRSQLMRARVHQWSPRAEAAFLRTLAASCNVRAACAAAGLTPSAAYQYRHRSKAFADLWNEALEIGTSRLEFALLENACDAAKGKPIDADAPIPRMSIDEAVGQLRRHKRALAGEESKRWRYRKPSMDDVRASILRKVEAIARHSALQKQGLPDWVG